MKSIHLLQVSQITSLKSNTEKKIHIYTITFYWLLDVAGLDLTETRKEQGLSFFDEFSPFSKEKPQIL